MQTPTISVLSPAKINTFLHVHQPRGDGFHELLTHFQPIDLYDEMTFEPNDSGVIRVHNPTLSIAEREDLCYRAAKCLQAYDKAGQGVDIHVVKRIPDGGGLGGGSSNAATTLVVLNKLWELNLSPAELLAIGLDLGSDVPFFIHGKPTLATGRGEIFHADKNNEVLKNQSIIVIKPVVSISTAKIFQSELLTKRANTGKIRDLDTARLICSGENDFESVVFALYPSVSQAAERLSSFSSAHLTGTGACLYTVLDDVKKADKIIDALGSDYQVFFVNALSSSPLNEFK